MASSSSSVPDRRRRPHPRDHYRPLRPCSPLPNAYNWRPGSTPRRRRRLGHRRPTAFTEQTIPADGLVLQPGLLYLAVTHKRADSETFAQILNGGRAIEALRSWVHGSAPLGHQDHAIRWTPEVRAVKPVRIYADRRGGAGGLLRRGAGGRGTLAVAGSATRGAGSAEVRGAARLT